MADSYIQAPPDSTGKKVATDEIARGGNQVHLEQNQLIGRGGTEVAEVKNTDPLSSHHGVAVRTLNTVNPISDALSSSALAAGASVDLDGTAVASAKIGKLMGVIVGSSAACRWDIKTRDGAVLVALGTVYTSGLAGGRPTFAWSPPDKRFDTIAHVSGDENFRVTATNLDSHHAADVSATIYWDEV